MRKPPFLTRIRSLGYYLEFRFLIFHRTRSNHYVEPTRLDHAVHVQIQKRKFIGRDREVDRLAFARRERDAPEILQLRHRAGHRTHQVADVELGDFIARALASVRDCYADFRASGRPDLRRRHFQIRVLEGRVAQSVAEREERLFAGEEITAPRRRLVVVCDRQLTDRTREAHRKLARRVVIAEQHVGHGHAGLLSQVEAFEDGRDFLGDVVDRERPAVDEHYDCWLARLQHGFDQIVLSAYQVQTVAVAEVIVRPTFLVRVLVAAEREHNHVRGFGDLDRFCDQFRVALGVVRRRAVAPPVPSLFRDLATFGVIDFDLLADLIAHSFEYADAASGVVAVAAQMNAGRIWADDRDGLQFGAIERQQAAFVLEQRDGTARGFRRQVLMSLAVGQLRRALRVDVRVLEEAEQKLRAQRSGHGPVQRGHRNSSLIDQLRKQRVTIGIGQLDVHARFERAYGGRSFVRSDLVTRGEFGDPEIIGSDHSFEPPLLPQYLFEQELAAVRRDAVNLIVRGHYAHHARFFHSGFKARQEDLAQNALRDIDRGNVRAAFWLAVRGEMLGRRHDMFAVNRRPRPLQRLDAGHAHTRNEIRVFAVSLFRPAPARVARQIEVRAEHLVAAANASLQRGGGEDFGDQIRVPTRRERDRSRETRAALRHVPVQSLVVKHSRDAQTRVLFQPLLKRVCVDSR